jgi:hypothetical protein
MLHKQGLPNQRNQQCRGLQLLLPLQHIEFVIKQQHTTTAASSLLYVCSLHHQRRTCL